MSTDRFRDTSLLSTPFPSTGKIEGPRSSEVVEFIRYCFPDIRQLSHISRNPHSGSQVFKAQNGEGPPYILKCFIPSSNMSDEEIKKYQKNMLEEASFAARRDFIPEDYPEVHKKGEITISDLVEDRTPPKAVLSGKFPEKLYFFIREYIVGTPMHILLRYEDFTQTQIVEVVKGIAEYLSLQHAMGVVHRDIKPRNTMVDDEGKAKVIDTGTTGFKGDSYEGVHFTLPYISPERVKYILGIGKNHTTDFSTDIFSLGALLYKSLTGRHIWEKELLASGSISYKFQFMKRIPPVKNIKGISDPHLRNLVVDMTRRQDKRAPIDYVVTELNKC